MEKKTRAIPTGKEQGMTYYKPLTPEFRARINWQTGGTGGKMKEMTPEEAIEILDNEYKRIELQIMSLKGTIKENTESFRYRIDVKESLKTAITALKEIQLYKDNKLCLVPTDVYSRQCSELDAYKEIGTVEECREAAEKQNQKPLDFYGDSEDGKLLCPSCGNDLWELKECGFNNCPYCEQAIAENLEGMEDE